MPTSMKAPSKMPSTEPMPPMMIRLSTLMETKTVKVSGEDAPEPGADECTTQTGEG